MLDLHVHGAAAAWQARLKEWTLWSLEEIMRDHHHYLGGEGEGPTTTSTTSTRTTTPSIAVIDADGHFWIVPPKRIL